MIIEKVVAPENISNKEPYGTKWVADLESGKQVWVQISKEKDKAEWIRLGSLCEDNYLQDLNELEKSGIIKLWLASLNARNKISKNE
jgi:hypothetical protein